MNFFSTKGSLALFSEVRQPHVLYGWIRSQNGHGCQRIDAALRVVILPVKEVKFEKQMGNGEADT